ncbi:MAG: hypothetical protein QXU60_02780 [Sulfolobales archaeon]
MLNESENFSEEEPLQRIIFIGRARIGEVLDTFKELRLRPEDFSSPIAFQMALTRLYENLMRSLSSGPKKSYLAEIIFQDSLGNQVSFAVDLGETPPPVESQNVRVKIIIEFYRD